MLFVRCCAGVIVWMGCVLFFAAIGGLGYLCYMKATNGSVTDTQTKDTYLYLSYTVWAIDGLCFFIFLCIFNKIRLAIAIIKSATLYMKDVPTSMLVPPLIMIFIGVWWAFWVFGAVCLYSMGTISKSNLGYNPFPLVTMSDK